MAKGYQLSGGSHLTPCAPKQLLPPQWNTTSTCFARPLKNTISNHTTFMALMKPALCLAVGRKPESLHLQAKQLRRCKGTETKKGSQSCQLSVPMGAMCLQLLSSR